MRMDASEKHGSYNSKSIRLSVGIENLLQKESILFISFKGDKTKRIKVE